VAVPADALSRAFSALGDPTRRDIVARLADGESTLTELAERYDVSVQAVSKHLKVLVDAGLVSRGQDAQRRPVRLEAEVLDLMTAWIERYRQRAEERYRRLDDLLATLPDDVDAAAAPRSRPSRPPARPTSHPSAHPPTTTNGDPR
jgi:DNA-binding transcriptional ArsR family regulator